MNSPFRNFLIDLMAQSFSRFKKNAIQEECQSCFFSDKRDRRIINFKLRHKLRSGGGKLRRHNLRKCKFLVAKHAENKFSCLCVDSPSWLPRCHPRARSPCFAKQNLGLLDPGIHFFVVLLWIPGSRKAIVFL